MGATINGDNSKKQLLGEILVRRNIVSQEKVDQALVIQQKEHGYIGEILVRLGFAQERDIVVALVIQCNLPYIAVNKYEISSAILKIIPREIAAKYKVIPLDKVGNVLSVVMVDPLDPDVKAELQKISNCQIASFIATREEVEKAIEKWYGNLK